MQTVKNDEKLKKTYLVLMPTIFPSTEEAVKTQPKQDKSFPLIFSSFLTVYLLFKCRFVA